MTDAAHAKLEIGLVAPCGSVCGAPVGVRSSQAVLLPTRPQHYLGMILLNAYLFLFLSGRKRDRQQALTFSPKYLQQPGLG